MSRNSRDSATEGAKRFFDHLFETLHAIDFHKGRSAKTIEQRLRRLFHRAMPDSRELRILHGVLADAERVARLAAVRRGDGKLNLPRFSSQKPMTQVHSIVVR